MDGHVLSCSETQRHPHPRLHPNNASTQPEGSQSAKLEARQIRIRENTTTNERNQTKKMKTKRMNKKKPKAKKKKKMHNRKKKNNTINYVNKNKE